MKTMKEKMLMFGAMFLISGATAFTTYTLMDHNSETNLVDVNGNPLDSNATKVSFMPAVNRSSVTENDFTKAAEMTVNAVVGVKSTQLVQMQTVGDPFFDLFFGYRGQQQQQPKAREGYGSGVIISSDGYIVTNNHVIADADSIQVTLNDKRQYDAVLVGTDPSTDIALLKIEGAEFPTVEFGQSDDLKIGEWVLAVGNPFMLNSTVTAGIVSAKARSLGMQSQNNGTLGIESFIQTDAAVNPGNSGGALVNTAGQLVGINTAIYSQTGNYAGYSFAVPSSIVSKVVTDLKQYGTVQRALLGVEIREIDAAFANEKKLSVTEGIFVNSVSDNSAAEEAGIKAGDIITAINGVDVKTFSQLQEQVARYRPGDSVPVTYMRDGKTKTVTAKFKNSKGDTSMVIKKGVEKLGVTLANMDNVQLRKFGVRNGVMVKSVDKGGYFSRAGIRENFVIVKINDTRISNDKDVEKVYDSLTSNRGQQEPVMFIVGVYPNGKTAYYAVDLSK